MGNKMHPIYTAEKKATTPRLEPVEDQVVQGVEELRGKKRKGGRCPWSGFPKPPRFRGTFKRTSHAPKLVNMDADEHGIKLGWQPTNLKHEGEVRSLHSALYLKGGWLPDLRLLA